MRYVPSENAGRASDHLATAHALIQERIAPAGPIVPEQLDTGDHLQLVHAHAAVATANALERIAALLDEFVGAGTGDHGFQVVVVK